MMDENEAPAASGTTDSASGEKPGAAAENGNMLVAIGASAGGGKALQKLIGAMPVSTGLSFAVILHTAADPDRVWTHLG